ncbi:PARP-type domain-containing protein (Fragment) [Durusdinium trenchii]|uniref:PARP-type domain-containing protein n=1 Tax=Durusdinium trenchii TaxID=1381693 RepID=A0ABP0IC19_9DINO
MSSSRDFLSQCFASRSTDCDSDREPTQADLQKKLKRKEQTQKARDASLVSRALKKAQKNGPNDEQTLTPAQTLQRKFLTGRLHHAYAMSRPYDVSAPDNQKSIQRERARCVWSLLCFLAKTLEDLFSMGTPVKHIINTIVPDDTTTRLRGPNPGDRTMVYTLMNQVQSCIVNYEKKLDSSNTGWHCLALPCPTSILHVADTPNIHAAYTSYLLASASGIGKGLQRLGLSQDLEGFHGAKWIAQVMCGDALEANSAAFNVERRLLTQRRERGERLNVVAIRFTAQLITLLKKPGVFERIQVSQYPPEMSEWQRRAAWLLKDFQAPAKVQEKLLGQILQFLNGDTRSDTITHWPLKSDQLLNDADFHLLVSNLLDEDKNYAAQNGRLSTLACGHSRTSPSLSPEALWVLVSGQPRTLADRRLVAEFLSPPFTLLALADADESSFVTGWQQLHLKYGECACCVDQEFTTPLLQAFPAFENDLSTPVTEDQQKDIQALQEFLSEVCTWSPLSSDAVEILNGQVQWALSRRGHQFVKQGKAAIETSLLARAVKHYNWLADAASKDTMPSKMDGRHPDRTREIMETDAEKRARFNHAATRKIRKLSGWNVFLKQQVQGESLDMGDYTRRVKDASKLWKTMSQDDKEAFEVEANHQEKLRGELAQQPLSAGHAAKAPTALEKAVGHNSCKRLSARRLKLNDEQFDCHGALKAEQIDMTLSDGDVQFKLDETLHQPIMSNQTDDLPEVHDSPCLPFICRTNCHYPRMQQLVKDLTWRLEEHKVKPASLLLFTVEHSNYPVLLGVSMKRPMSHIFVNAALDADQVSLTDARGTLPQFQSSHELMLKLLREHSPNPDSTLDVTVDVWGDSDNAEKEEEQAAPMSSVVATEQRAVQEAPADFMLHGYLGSEPIGLKLVEGFGTLVLPVFVICFQDGKCTSERRREFVKSCRNALGLGPNGPMVFYSQHHLGEDQRRRLNARETESLDIQYASLVVTCFARVPSHPDSSLVPDCQHNKQILPVVKGRGLKGLNQL